MKINELVVILIKYLHAAINLDGDNHLIEMINYGKSVGSEILPRTSIEPLSSNSQAVVTAISLNDPI